jgi:hypothetical protein
MIRDCKRSNPFEIEKVKDFIKRDLDPIYQRKYERDADVVNITSSH